MSQFFSLIIRPLIGRNENPGCSYLRFVALLSVASFLSLTSLYASEAKPRIVTTTGMITDITREVGGNAFEVVGLMKAGIDPHLYKPTRTDIATLNSADLVFYNGLLLEGKMTDAFQRIASAGKQVFPVTQLLNESYLLEPPEFQGHFDPHVWMDPIAWEEAVKLVASKLSEFSPTRAAEIDKRAQDYLQKLERLDDYAKNALSSVPQNSRVLVTAHDAFNYFGRRYGYEVLGIQGISTESEAGVKDIERIVGILVNRKIKAVFVESTVSRRNIQALVEGAVAKGHTVIIGGQLFSDAFGEEGTYEGTYLGMIDHNVTTITRALGGNAPRKGMNGKLSL